LPVDRLRVTSIVGTRPEIIRLSRVIAKLDAHCDHRLVHTGQNYDIELNEIFFRELGIRAPDHALGCAGRNAAETIGNVIIATDRLLEAHPTDAVLILGDTNSSLAAIAAKRRKIPIFHLEAGNRCFDQRVPEEINRRIVDHISDVNLTYSGFAREMLLREGLPPDRVIKVGSPLFEVLEHHRAQIEGSGVLEAMGLEPGRFFVASLHREESIEPDDAFARVIEVLDAVAERHGQPIVLSTHPRTRQRIERSGRSFHPLVRLVKPLGFPDYVQLQLSARAVLSDSGSLTEEASILGFPALNLREVQERHEGMEEAAVMLVGLDATRVLQGLEVLATYPRLPARHTCPVADYCAPDFSEKVVRLILSYKDYVDRVVWRKAV
jgi:UDP-N-acetylglucosamine 2-epimerase (non-hydrolysing)